MGDPAPTRLTQYTLIGAGVLVSLFVLIHLAGYGHTIYTHYSAARVQVTYQESFDRCTEGRVSTKNPAIERARMNICMERLRK